MKNILLTLSLVFAAYTASVAQCTALWQGWSTANNTAYFYDSSATNPAVTTYAWDFGDGTAIDTNQNPTHQYNGSGWFNVCLSIETQVNGAICRDTWCDSLYVGQAPASCNAHFTHSGNPNGGSAISFSNQSQSSGGGVYYLWDFGDGDTSSLTNPTHTYAVADSYVVCLTQVMYSNGTVLCTDTYCSTVIVTGHTSSCSAIFGYQTSGHTVYLTGGTNSYNYHWDLGDGASATLPNLTYTYGVAGTYTVCLTVTDPATSCTDTYCTAITVGSNTTTCDASYQAYPSNVSNYQYFFDAANPNGPIYSSHHWDFDDGTTDSTSSPAHTFPGTGIYVVCHTVTSISANGTVLCTDTHCDSVVVTAMQSCHAAFNSSPTNNTHTTFQFTNYSSSSGTLSYQWSFGDGHTSNATNPAHTYAQSGTYTVCLTVFEGSNGAIVCTDSVCNTIQVGSSNSQHLLQGMIWSDSSTGVWNEAEVFLIQYDSLTQTLTSIDTVTTLYGQYEFRGVVSGHYLLKAALLPNYPAYNDYLPTYYQSVLFWYDAATVTVPNPANSWYHIYMVPGNNPGGPGFVGGNVNQGANKQASGDPLEGVQVMLLNLDDSPLQYTLSAADGSFSFADVAYGTYKVYAEVLGKPTYPSQVTISAAKETVDDVAIVVEEEGVYSAVTEIDVTYIGGTNLYPNPVSSTSTLSFNAKEAGLVTLQVINILGQVVAQQEVNVLPGKQFATIDMGGEQAGVYFLTISFNNHVASHIRFIRD